MSRRRTIVVFSVMAAWLGCMHLAGNASMWWAVPAAIFGLAFTYLVIHWAASPVGEEEA